MQIKYNEKYSQMNEPICKNNTHLQTGHRHDPLSQFSCKYDSKSKHCMCLHSCPRAGNVIFLKVMGHFNETFNAVCSTLSLSLVLFEPLLLFAGDWLKFILILAMQWSAVNRRFFSSPWRTLRTLGRWTSWSTNKCDYKQ